MPNPSKLLGRPGYCGATGSEEQKGCGPGRKLGWFTGTFVKPCSELTQKVSRAKASIRLLLAEEEEEKNDGFTHYTTGMLSNSLLFALLLLKRRLD